VISRNTKVFTTDAQRTQIKNIKTVLCVLVASVLTVQLKLTNLVLKK